jgi:hypothetical protein
MESSRVRWPGRCSRPRTNLDILAHELDIWAATDGQDPAEVYRPQAPPTSRRPSLASLRRSSATAHLPLHAVHGDVSTPGPLA